MQLIFAIAAGGATGAVLRHLMAGAVNRLMGSDLPVGTLSVNVLGCLLLGLLTGLLALRVTLSAEVRAFLSVGMLGGFTTFSTFAMQGGLLIERGQMGIATLYMIGSIVLGLGAFMLGLWAVRVFAGAPA